MTSADADSASHSHVFLGRAHDENARRTMWVMVLTAAMMVAEIVAGLVFGSMALLADGVHMATHAGAFAVSAGAYAFASRHANNPRFTFGTGKVGDLAGFASAIILAFVALGIAVESVLRVLEPQSVAFGQAALVAAVGLAVNLLCALLLAGGSHHRHHPHSHDHHHDHAHSGREAHAAATGDNNLRSAYLHVLADALTSVLAIAALVGGYYLGWWWLDPAVGIVGSAVIACWSWALIRATADVLLDATVPAVERDVREVVEHTGAQVTDLHLWRVGPEACAVIVSVTGAVSGDVIRARLRGLPGLAHVTVEARPTPAGSAARA
ncbi:Cation transporter [uncultured Defluviicoccus sp.]|uniref:Cation transporter n=1 Tax=metagenome TaxID=256318 RepID=A0A380TGV4_9ZZZZ|nr:Cation transporter [uncultured Defluviicoccus sp.]